MARKLVRPLRIGVIGSAEATAAGEEVAWAVGRALALAGAVVICGGGGGVMEAASAGASEAGGLVLGFLPGTDANACAVGPPLTKVRVPATGV